jgi:hypothetical protein
MTTLGEPAAPVAFQARQRGSDDDAWRTSDDDAWRTSDDDAWRTSDDDAWRTSDDDAWRSSGGCGVFRPASEAAMTTLGEPAASRHAWLQKHPSPAAAGGEFHWYPEAGDRELRASLVERVRGVEPPAVLWQLEPRRVAWSQVFSAVAPGDGRRYVGLVLSVVEGRRSAAELLATLALPPAGPWGTTSAERAFGVRGVRGLEGEPPGDAVGVVRALLSGGAARVGDPTSPALPAWIASIERVLPAAPPRSRAGAWTTVTSPVHDRVAALGAAAWAQPQARAAEAWTLLEELAIARGESIDTVGRALAALDVDAALMPGERAALPARARVVDALHAWGRGRLDGSPGSATLVTRLADLVALRVLVRLAAGEEPREAIAEARWHALLPAARRAALLAAVASRTASLGKIVAGIDGDATTRGCVARRPLGGR